MALSKCKSLTLEEKMTVIKNKNNGKSARRIAEEMGVGRTQIQGIIMYKPEIRDEHKPEREDSIEIRVLSPSHSTYITMYSS